MSMAKDYDQYASQWKPFSIDGFIEGNWINDFKELAVTSEKESKERLDALLRKPVDKLKKDFGGWTAWIITSNLDAAKFIGLRPTRKITLFNGSLECRLFKFEMYAGTKKIHKLQPKEE